MSLKYIELKHQMTADMKPLVLISQKTFKTSNKRFAFCIVN